MQESGHACSNGRMTQKDLLPRSCPSCSFPADGCSALRGGKQSGLPSCLLPMHGRSRGPSPVTVPGGQAVRQDRHFFATTACFPCSDPGAPLPAGPGAPATSGNEPARRCSLPCNPSRAPSGRTILRPSGFRLPGGQVCFPAAHPHQCCPGHAWPRLPTSARRH